MMMAINLVYIIAVMGWLARKDLRKPKLRRVQRLEALAGESDD